LEIFGGDREETLWRFCRDSEDAKSYTDYECRNLGEVDENLRMIFSAEIYDYPLENRMGLGGYSERILKRMLRDPGWNQKRCWGNFEAKGHNGYAENVKRMC
jgi:hypothetical protein